MKAKFTFLVVLFLLTTSIYAVEPAHNKSSKLAGNFLKNRLERTEKRTEHIRFQRKMVFQKQSNSLKSAQAIKQRLDSYTSQEWDASTSQWVTEYKLEFAYDDNGNMTHDFDYELDETTGKLVLYYKSDYSYDANGNMTQAIYYEWDENSNQITADYKETFSYDANGNMTQSIDYMWDKITNQFVTVYKYDYTYDASGNLTLEIESNFDANQVENKTKKEYKYDDKGKLTLTTSFDFSANTNEWIKNSYEEYSYDSKGNNTLILKTIHEGTINGVEQWGYSVKEEYTYDANGQVTQYLYSRMENNGWVVNEKYSSSYDDKRNNTQNIYYNYWDEQTNQWEYIDKSEYTFDYNYTTDELILPWWWEEDIDFLNSNMITEIKSYYWNHDTNGWESDEKATFSYSPVNVTSVNQLNAKLSRVFPNPCSESVFFSFPDFYSQITFELFDLQGRKLLSKAIGNNEEKINMEGFGSGMYLYLLNIDGKMQSGKLMKK